MSDGLGNMNKSFYYREPPFGYENGENIGEIKRAILKGITEEHLKKVLNKDLRSLVERLLQVNQEFFNREVNDFFNREMQIRGQ